MISSWPSAATNYGSVAARVVRLSFSYRPPPPCESVLHLKIGAAFLVVNIISATIMVFASQSFDGVGRWVSGGVALLFAVNAALVTRAAVGKRGYSGVNFASMAAIFLVLMASALFQIEAQSYRPADPQDVSLSQAKFVATCPPVANLLAKYLSESPKPVAHLSRGFEPSLRATRQGLPSSDQPACAARRRVPARDPADSH